MKLVVDTSGPPSYLCMYLQSRHSFDDDCPDFIYCKANNNNQRLKVNTNLQIETRNWLTNVLRSFWHILWRECNLAKMVMPRTSKILQYLNWRVRVTLSDTRYMIGTFLAFDKHMNLVLADTEEFRVIKPKKGSASKEVKEEKRVLGLIILRGINVVNFIPETPPPAKNKAAPLPGAGVGRVIPATGRGMPQGAPMGLAGPVRGIGGPAPVSMLPTVPQVPSVGRGFPPVPAAPFGNVPPAMGRGGFMPSLPGVAPPLPGAFMPGMPPPPPGSLPGRGLPTAGPPPGFGRIPQPPQPPQ
jgi:small nuclear ribonucleoprotein B and B'